MTDDPRRFCFPEDNLTKPPTLDDLQRRLDDWRVKREQFPAIRWCRTPRDDYEPNYVVPPWNKIGNLKEVAITIQAIRDAWGPVLLTSVYRPSEYNALVGGAENSRHLHACAADFAPVGEDIEHFSCFVDCVQAVVNSLRTFEYLNDLDIGLGVYQTSEDKHLHLDIVHKVDANIQRNWGEEREAR